MLGAATVLRTRDIQVHAYAADLGRIAQLVRWSTRDEPQ